MNYNGSCQCGEVHYKVEGTVTGFFLCHCRYCQKDTGSAHAANLFVPQGKLSWESGFDFVRTFCVPNTRHQKSFCIQCGSALPNEQSKDDVIVIPAGSLDGEFAIRPNAHLFSASRAPWDHNLEDLRVFDQLPL